MIRSATRSQPRKPIVQHLAVELAANGVDQHLLVTRRNKNSIKNHFDFDLELISGMNGPSQTLARMAQLFEHRGSR